MTWSLTLLALSLLLASTSVSAQQTTHILTVPVYQSVPASLTHMRTVLTALQATVDTETTVGFIIATFGSQRRTVTVQSDGIARDPTTGQSTTLTVICVDDEGGAAALCREIQRRYENQ